MSGRDVGPRVDEDDIDPIRVEERRRLKRRRPCRVREQPERGQHRLEVEVTGGFRARTPIHRFTGCKPLLLVLESRSAPPACD